MSHYRLKTTYNEEGPYGTTEEKILFVEHNLSTDRVSFFHEDGSLIFSVPDTISNNILDAINKLYTTELGNNGPEIEDVTAEESRMLTYEGKDLKGMFLELKKAHAANDRIRFFEVATKLGFKPPFVFFE